MAPTQLRFLLHALMAAATVAAESTRFLGRVNPATRELTWPATGIAVAFDGTTASIPITSQWGTVAVEMVIDDGPPIAIPNVDGSAITTPAGLPRGRHTMTVRKKSEAYFGSLFVGQPTTDGELVDLGPRPKRSIEIIGDSISVGYGLEGVFPCANAADNEAATKTYGALTANNLSADYSIVAWSGKGVTRNYVAPGPDLDLRMPELWTRWGAGDETGSYDFAAPVDAVVINLGTNDFSFDPAVRPQLDVDVFSRAFAAFLAQVRGAYPSAVVFLTGSPLLNDATAERQKSRHSAVMREAAERSGPDVHFVEFPTQDASGNNIGCDYHPSARTNQELAVILTAAMRSVMGWDACKRSRFRA
ncbi:lipolytic enzyme [Pyricularia oryzae]|uniref:Lipolytic enzyme n=1 Tax=Pyricularia oryzae (strain Y34) TaxID=1143189 RepID=A0AA97P5H4_PYRO3|nr:lipolytic enzyme [Pyricularia oryzae Y34]KAI7915651.1 lipolytic enzyme [Pyricularia oryzae]